MNDQLQKFIGKVDLLDIALVIAIVILSLNDAYGSGWLLLFFFLKNIE